MFFNKKDGVNCFMKKILIFTLLLVTITLAGCRSEEVNCTDEQIKIDGECVDEDTPDTIVCDTGYIRIDGNCYKIYVPPHESTYSYIIKYLSGVDNMNPYSETSESAIELYDLLTDSLYEVDFAWDRAVSEGLATEVGDFETSGAAGRVD